MTSNDLVGYFLGSILGVGLVVAIMFLWNHIKACFKSWSAPSKPIETFYDDDSPPKAEVLKPALRITSERGKKNDGDERLFWLEQEFGRFRSQLDLFHPLKSGLDELRGLVAKLSDEVSALKASTLGSDAAQNHRIGIIEADLNKRESQLDSLSIELSNVIDTTKKFHSTLEHILRTRVSEENHAALKQTVGNHTGYIFDLQGQVKKLNTGTSLEAARLTEVINELKREHTQTRSDVNNLQDSDRLAQHIITKRLTALEQARTDEAKFYDAARQSADIKSVAGFEARESVKGFIEAAKSELADTILKKFAGEVQEVFDRRYVRVENTPATPVKRNRKRRLDAAEAERKSVEAFINKAKARNEKALSKRRQ